MIATGSVRLLRYWDDDDAAILLPDDAQQCPYASSGLYEQLNTNCYYGQANRPKVQKETYQMTTYFGGLLLFNKK